MLVQLNNSIKMNLFTFCLIVVIQSAVCTFPSYIHPCSLPNPNACILNSAKFALPHLIIGNPSLNLVSFLPYHYNGEILSLAPNALVVLNGKSYPSIDTNIVDARIDMDNKFWVIEATGSSIKMEFNFTATINEAFEEIKIKGRTTITYGNWNVLYTGYYETHKINNKNYMQIYYSNTEFAYDNYMQNYFDLTYLNGVPLTGLNLVKAKYYSKNFEPSMSDKIEYLTTCGIHNAFNTILLMETEENLFS